MVLGRRTHHGGATDVDVLDAVGEGRALGDGCAEGVQVHHHDLDRLAAQLQQLAQLLSMSIELSTSTALMFKP